MEQSVYSFINFFLLVIDAKIIAKQLLVLPDLVKTKVIYMYKPF